MINSDTKLFNIIDYPYIFNNMEKDPNTFYLVNTHIKSNKEDVLLMYIGNKLITPIIDIATDKIAGIIRSGGYIKVLPDGKVKVLNSDTADKLTKPVNIGDVKFDGSSNITLKDIGAIKQRRWKITLAAASWTQSATSISTSGFTYEIEVTPDNNLTHESDGDLMIDSNATQEQINACINSDINIVEVTSEHIVLSAITRPAIDIPIEIIYTTEK